jgi:hypothetical protein
MGNWKKCHSVKCHSVKCHSGNCHSVKCHSGNYHSEAVPQGDFLRGAGRGICCLPALTSTIFAPLALILLCLAAPAATAAEELGRLFLTPQQRQDLDRRRSTNRAEEEAPQIREGPLTLEGHVQRSSGKSTTWINGVPQDDSHASRDPARLTVVPNVGEPGVSLKIGQIYERAGATVRDGLNGGEVKVKPGPDRSVKK